SQPAGIASGRESVLFQPRNASLTCVGRLILRLMHPADRYLWTLPMFHANGWTFVWAVTAVGAGHVCLRRVEPLRIFELISSESVSMFCAAPTVLIGVASAPAEVRAGAPRGLRVVTPPTPPP